MQNTSDAYLSIIEAVIWSKVCTVCLFLLEMHFVSKLQNNLLYVPSENFSKSLVFVQISFNNSYTIKSFLFSFELSWWFVRSETESGLRVQLCTSFLQIDDSQLSFWIQSSTDYKYLSDDDHDTWIIVCCHFVKLRSRSISGPFQVNFQSIQIQSIHSNSKTKDLDLELTLKGLS